MQKEIIGNSTLYCGDNIEILNNLNVNDSNIVVIADPQYGINLNTDYTKYKTKVNSKYSKYDNLRNSFKKIHSDNKPFNPEVFLKYKKIILWGANNYSDKLPIGSWLYWDKRADNGHALKSEGEVAWMNIGKMIYYFDHCWHGFARASETSKKERIQYHPTQKPIALMEWCIELLNLTENDIVLDPFMGSGTTGIACVRQNRNFIGIEIEQEYFDISCKRIEEEYQYQKNNKKFSFGDFFE